MTSEYSNVKVVIRMFTGHYAVALAAKRVAPTTSMGALFLAVQLLDVLWVPAILMGIETAKIVPGFLPASSIEFLSISWTHGLLMAIAWGWFTARFLKNYVLGACVFSHWLLDYIVHAKDLPIYRGGSLVGLGLWNYRGATFVVESLLLVLGLLVYLRATQVKTAAGRYAMSVYVAALIVVDAINLYGPPAANITAAAISAEIAYVTFAAIAWWLDRMRKPLVHVEPPISIVAGIE